MYLFCNQSHQIKPSLLYLTLLNHRLRFFIISLKSGKFWSINMIGFQVLPQRGSYDERCIQLVCLSVKDPLTSLRSVSIWPDTSQSSLSSSTTQDHEPKTSKQFGHYEKVADTIFTSDTIKIQKKKVELKNHTRLMKLPACDRPSTEVQNALQRSHSGLQYWWTFVKIQLQLTQTRILNSKIRVSGHRGCVSYVAITLQKPYLPETNKTLLHNRPDYRITEYQSQCPSGPFNTRSL